MNTRLILSAVFPLLFAVPNVSPNLRPVGFNTSSTSLDISWKAIARADINGVLRGYIVFYKPYSSEGTCQNVTVSPDKVSVRLTDLRKYTEYELRVAGVTSKGTGDMSEKSLVYTDEDGRLNKLYYVSISKYLYERNGKIIFVVTFVITYFRPVFASKSYLNIQQFFVV